ncbi:peptidylprolyl isomerase [Pseudohongiella acticola]|jgi:peptidyl-prolyl cis-trans isomerase B (cyclophilin B)|uniref:peptidylprolyl isomerase n=1 Tax=Pseudohongiella acticola TaxID=1524254 RepID=UPI0009F6CA3B|nr:peptidylprolyl isomerase [Pseudohongiella acticola]
MKTGNLVSIVLLAVTLLAPVPNAFGQPLSALISTSKGEIELELNARAAPTTVANFVNLARRGFYDGLSFHRFEPRFMIQGGDPLGTGTGTPGYRFSGETHLRHNRPGVISMANSGPGTEGSQFFITHVRTPHLDGLHSVFGGVTQGMDVVNSLRAGDIIERITISGDISALWAQKAGQLESWNAVLNENYPDLRPAPTP